jgi:hypothetical protein
MIPEIGDTEIPWSCPRCPEQFRGPEPTATPTNRYRTSYYSDTARSALMAHERNHGSESPQARRLRLAGLEPSTAIFQRIVSGNMGPRETLHHAKGFLSTRPAAYVVSGGTGCGKTLSGWFLIAQVDGGVFLLAPELGRPVSDAQRSGFITSPLLVLDDAGLEHLGPTEYAVSQIDEIVVAREMHGRPTYITTNLGPSAFQKRYGERVWSRVMGSGGFVECAGEDMRREPGEDG